MPYYINSINIIVAYPSEAVRSGEVEEVALLDPKDVNKHAYVYFRDKLIPVNVAAMHIYEKLAA